MDEKTAGNLSKFMLDLHEEGMGIISRNVFLKKYRFLQESFAERGPVLFDLGLEFLQNGLLLFFLRQLDGDFLQHAMNIMDCDRLQ